MADSKLMFDIFAVDRASKVFDKVGERADHLGGRLGKVGKAGALMGKLVAGAAIGGVAILGGAFIEGLKSAADYQKITAQTGAVIKSTGGQAHVTAAHVEELAKSVEEYSTFSDEAVQQGENLLLTFTNIQNKAGKGNDIFDQATKSLYDMAQALGEDPQKAAIQLGKALNDPVKGITALKRVGVSFSAGQQKVIDHLVKTGHVAEAQKIILRELNKEFGGSAKAAGDTFAGSMTRLKNTLMDTLRDAVTPLLPALVKLAGWLGPKLVAGLQFVVTGVRTFIDGFTNNTDDLIAQGTKWTDPFVNAGFAVRDAFNRILPAVKAVAGWVKNDLVPVIKELAGWVRGDLVPAFTRMVSGVLPKVVELFKTVKEAIHNNQGAINGVKAALIIFGAILTNVVLPVVGFLANRALGAVIRQFKVASLVIRTIVVPAFRFLVDMWLNIIGWIIDGAAKAFGWIPGIGPKLKKASSDFHKFKNDVNDALNGIKKNVTISFHADMDAAIRKALALGGTAGARAAQSAHGIAGARASGGPVKAGLVYRVGERGEELFSPNTDGTIIPNGHGGTSSSSISGDFTASAPLVIKLDSGIIWQGLVTMKRRRGNISLGLT